MADAGDVGHTRRLRGLCSRCRWRAMVPVGRAGCERADAMPHKTRATGRASGGKGRNNGSRATYRHELDGLCPLVDGTRAGVSILHGDTDSELLAIVGCLVVVKDGLVDAHTEPAGDTGRHLRWVCESSDGRRNGGVCYWAFLASGSVGAGPPATAALSALISSRADFSL